MVRTVAKSPSEARYVPRLVKSRGANALQRETPWLPFRAIEYLESIATGAVVFEFGAGGSTAWFSRRAARVVSVEHDASWYEALCLVLADRPNVELLFAEVELTGASGYVAAIDRFPDEHFDIVLIDGRRRLDCLSRAVAKVRPGGRLILDDSEREKYAHAGSLLVGWPRQDFSGLVPCKDRAGQTSVFTRPPRPARIQGSGGDRR